MQGAVVGRVDTDADFDSLDPGPRADPVRLLLGGEVELSFGKSDIRIRVALADVVAELELLVDVRGGEPGHAQTNQGYKFHLIL